MTRDYETLTKIHKVKRVLRTALVTLVLCLLVLIPSLRAWETSVETRSALGSAKNVLLNTELLSLQYFGYKGNPVDLKRPSGLSEKAEADVLNYSGVKGTFRIESWDTVNRKVLSMTYSEHGYMVKYTYEPETGEAYWDILKPIKRIYKNE